ncbi:hypothetical protein PIROE2DRAFT_7211 [Piromyces sp. E2]|nr:hypothetical protein PIROE2DRAFT_7211 [Piromyces sp. E2]|eukprot:OUM65713.1 hypothetical protein PIROE2DRAFT_7211 [Piromyces sp. E2]
MKILFVDILAILIDCILSNAIDRGDYLELHTSSKAYMFTTDGSNTYLCQTYKSDTSQLDLENPDGCDIKGVVTIKSNLCYLMSNGFYAIYNPSEAKCTGTYGIFDRIRYFDLRIENEENLLHISHGYIDSLNKKTGDLYYLSDVFNEAIDFLHNNPNETVIMHLKKERIKNMEDEDLFKCIADLTVLKTYDTYDMYGKAYNKYFHDEIITIKNDKDKKE